MNDFHWWVLESTNAKESRSDHIRSECNLPTFSDAFQVPYLCLSSTTHANTISDAFCIRDEAKFRVPIKNQRCFVWLAKLAHDGFSIIFHEISQNSTNESFMKRFQLNDDNVKFAVRLDWKKLWCICNRQIITRPRNVATDSALNVHAVVVKT